MTDIMPQRPDSLADAPGAPRVQSTGDPLATLHKMSTTAGLGTTEYVAINPLAVATFFLGLASSLALLDNTLLAVPALTLVIAIVALRQIIKSGGTQTGKGLAVAGLVLAAAFSGIVVARSIAHDIRTKQDTEQISRLVESFSHDLTEGNAEQAYKGFSKRFASLVSFQEFSGRMDQLKKVVKSMKSNGRLNFYVDPDTGETLATGMAITEFEAGTDRLEVVYRKEPTGEWVIDKMQFFPEQKEQQRQAGAPR